MSSNPIVFSIFLIFTGAAVLSTLALFTRQSLLVAYMILGILFGPAGLGLVHDNSVISEVGDIGIIFLLFLLGMELDPKRLLTTLRKSVLVTLVSSATFAFVGFAVGICSGLTMVESIIMGAAMMFSSTIIGLKLLPPAVLHNRHIGEIIIGVLLIQDLIAILVLSILQGLSGGDVNWGLALHILIVLPVLVFLALGAKRLLIKRLISRYERMREYLFLLAIAWCLTFSELASAFGLSHEIGAFVAGVALASSPVSHYLVEYMQPVRDFFLVLFFFAVGAGFNIPPGAADSIIIPAMVLGVVMVLLKPLMFRSLLTFVGETKQIGWEAGFRLGQISEFAILIAYLASDQSGLLGPRASNIIQAAALLTFFLSSYVVVWKYPTPISQRHMPDDD